MTVLSVLTLARTFAALWNVDMILLCQESLNSVFFMILIKHGIVSSDWWAS